MLSNSQEMLIYSQKIPKTVSRCKTIKVIYLHW